MYSTTSCTGPTVASQVRFNQNTSIDRGLQVARAERTISDDSSGKDKLSASIKAGLKDLLVLKSSGSAFEGFLQDEYTTLKPVADRIFSTAVEAEYTLSVPAGEMVAIEKLGELGKTVGYRTIAKNVKDATLETFAVDESASVQVRAFSSSFRDLFL